MMSHSLPVRLFSAALLLSVACAFGCSKPAADANKPADSKPADSGHAHDHAEEGPHHGHLIEVGGGKYHAELTHDDTNKTITIYVLGGDAKTAVPIPEPEVILNLVADGMPVQAKLAAAPLEGEPAGQSSRFSLVDEKVLDLIEGPKTTIRLNITIAGQAYNESVEHDDHGHDHKH
jgi:hypothetical protein